MSPGQVFWLVGRRSRLGLPTRSVAGSGLGRRERTVPTYSGGAAPASHRLPFGPRTVFEVSRHEDLPSRRGDGPIMGRPPESMVIRRSQRPAGLLSRRRKVPASHAMHGGARWISRWSAEQQTWHDAAVRFARRELVDDLLGRDERRRVLARGVAALRRFGIQGLPVPVEYGGQGQDLPVTIAAMEGLGYGCPDNGLIFAINASLWTNTIPILRYGTEEQKRRYLPGLCDGTLVGANGASEAEAGSDIFSMQTRAERRGDRWVLNGRKTWVTSGPVADLFVCYATTDPAKGVLGICAFLVPRDTPGLPRRPRDPQAGRADGADGRAGLRGLRAARREPARPRGAGGRGLQLLDGVGAGRDPRQHPGHDAPAARTLHRARPTPQAVRQADRQVPVGRQPDRRHEAAAGDVPPAGLQDRLAQGAGQGRDARGGDGQAPRLGLLRPEQPRRRPALRRRRGSSPRPASSATCATASAA